MTEQETIASFDGTPLAVYRWGPPDGVPVVLCHGFAADTRMNFEAPGIVGAIVAAGRRVVGFDARAHGQSGKSHDPADYAGDAMTKDVGAVLDALDIDTCDLVGYSMGSFTAYRFVHQDSRPRSLVLGGVGAHVLRGQPPQMKGISEAMMAADAGDVTDPTAKGFRRFAESTGADLKALAALQRAPRSAGEYDASRVKIPTLVCVGEKDDLVGDPKKLVAALPDARLVVTPGDHLGAVAEPAFRQALVDFLTSQD